MRFLARKALLGAGAVMVVGAALHVAIAIGVPAWYRFFGAPQPIIDMARNGDPQAAITCAVIAGILLVFAGYAFSGAGIFPRLPLLRSGLAVIGGVLILRGVLFVPIIALQPQLLARVCDCRRVDTFIVVTSLLCLGLGFAYALGASHRGGAVAP